MELKVDINSLQQPEASTRKCWTNNLQPLLAAWQKLPVVTYKKQLHIIQLFLWTFPLILHWPPYCDNITHAKQFWLYKYLWRSDLHHKYFSHGGPTSIFLLCWLRTFHSLCGVLFKTSISGNASAAHQQLNITTLNFSILLSNPLATYTIHKTVPKPATTLAYAAKFRNSNHAFGCIYQPPSFPETSSPLQRGSVRHSPPTMGNARKQKGKSHRAEV
jgi:hypothetical protein